MAFNKSACELQCGKYADAVESAQVCIEILRDIEREAGNFLAMNSKD